MVTPLYVFVLVSGDSLEYLIDRGTQEFGFRSSAFQFFDVFDRFFASIVCNDQVPKGFEGVMHYGIMFFRMRPGFGLPHSLFWSNDAESATHLCLRARGGLCDPFHKIALVP
jgi:hypothetical protein